MTLPLAVASSSGVVTTLIAIGVGLAAPLLWAALGELIVEKSGVLNVGIEGVLIIGCFACAWGYHETGSMLVGIGAAIASGALCGGLLSLLYVRMAADQIVTGILFSVVAIGATTLLGDQLLGSSVGVGTATVAVPLLSDIPGVGPALFRQDALVYAAALAIPVVLWLIRGTWFGLAVRATGEKPRAVETAGISVRAVRTYALTLGCAVTSVGGASLVLGSSGGFSPGMTGGRGYMALAIVVLGRWNPLGLALAAVLIGMSEALQFVAGRLGFLGDVPAEVLLMLPYVVTILAVVFSRSSRYPAACGVPYRPARA